MASLSYYLLVDQLNGKADAFPQYANRIRACIQLFENLLAEDANKEKKISFVIDNFLRALECIDCDVDSIRSKASDLLSSKSKNLDVLYGYAKQFSREHERTDNARFIDLRSERQAEPYRLEEIRTSDRIEILGKIFKNCLANADRAREYHNRIRERSLTLWLILNENKPIAVFSVDVELSEIEEFEGKDGSEDVEIPFAVAIEILKKLDIQANGVPAFARVGAYDRFKNSQPRVSPIEVNGKKVWIWRYRREIIIAVDEYSDGVLYWSRFVNPGKGIRPNRFHNCSEGNWCGTYGNHLEVGDLLQLLLENPHVLEKLNSPNLDEE